MPVIQVNPITFEKEPAMQKRCELPRKRTRCGRRAVHVPMAALLMSMLIAACAGGDDAARAEHRRDAGKAVAKRATERLVGTLMGEVQRNIKERGLAATVSHCATRAQEISTLVGAEEGVTIRRVTEKTRNPVDAPDTYERRILAQFADMAAEGRIDPSTVHAEVLSMEGRNVLRFLKPIMIGKTCLGCHGDAGSIPADVAQALRTHYPSDLATGYREGELRGAVSVIVPLDE